MVNSIFMIIGRINMLQAAKDHRTHIKQDHLVEMKVIQIGNRYLAKMSKKNNIQKIK